MVNAIETGRETDRSGATAAKQRQENRIAGPETEATEMGNTDTIELQTKGSRRDGPKGTPRVRLQGGRDPATGRHSHETGRRQNAPDIPGPEETHTPKATQSNANTISIEGWPLIRGTRRGTRTTNPSIDECIAKLDKAGVWFRLRGSALWQAPEGVSEESQIAMVLNELSDADHYRYMDHALIAQHLEAKTVMTLRDTLANDARLTRAAWRFWTRKCGHDPDAHPGGGPNDGTAQGAWGRGGDESDDPEAHKFARMRDADDGTEQWLLVG